MTEPLLNDNDPVAGRDAAGGTDARGHAALLLTESLLHGLIARSILSAGDAIDIVQTAAEIQRETIADAIGPETTMERSLALLVTMQRSLDADLPRG